MICEICSYSWTPRVASPKACPRCKRRFDYKEIQDAVRQIKKELNLGE